MWLPWADRTWCPPTIPGWPSAWRVPRAGRRMCSSTIAGPSTCRAATWPCAATRFSRSAASIRSTCAPATTSTSAGACKVPAARSVSRRRRSCGITIAPRLAPTGASRSATARARCGCGRTIRTSSAGSRIQWRGHVYSPLPFVKSLSTPQHQRRAVGHGGVSVGVSERCAGTRLRAAHAHVAGRTRCCWCCRGCACHGPARKNWARPRSLAGLAGIATTIARCVRHALASDIRGLAPVAGLTPAQSRIATRALIAWLHVLQPLARARGLVRGIMTSPEFELAQEHAVPAPAWQQIAEVTVVHHTPARPHLLVGVVAGARSAAHPAGGTPAEHARGHCARDRRRVGPGP